MEPGARALSSPVETWTPGECVGSVTLGLWRPWGGGESEPGARGGRRVRDILNRSHFSLVQYKSFYGTCNYILYQISGVLNYSINSFVDIS